MRFLRQHHQDQYIFPRGVAGTEVEGDGSANTLSKDLSKICLFL